MPSTKFVRKGFSFIFSTRCPVETDTIENPLMKSAPILAVLHYLHVTHAFLLFSQYISKDIAVYLRKGNLKKSWEGLSTFQSQTDFDVPRNSYFNPTQVLILLETPFFNPTNYKAIDNKLIKTKVLYPIT
jgi:hypothetical protein